MNKKKPQKTKLNKKDWVKKFLYPGGELNQKKLLESESHKVIKKGKKYFVENYQNNLTPLLPYSRVW